MARHDTRQPNLAHDVLRTAFESAPGNESLLRSLIEYCSEAGLDEEAARHTRTLQLVRGRFQP